MAKYRRVAGGEKNEKSGIDWTRSELEKVCDLYIELGGDNIHENNPKIHSLASKLGRTIRSVENQLLAYKTVASNKPGRKNYNRLIPLIWRNKTQKPTKETSKKEFRFRISSALKDIIGQDLITDDYIAVFELVKNSYDAYANRVDIYFENIYTNNGKIIIKDNGKGMDASDLREKWLFVAYSAKKEGTEDDSFDYRDNIYKKRAFAGAKGIGRFSCDRLGMLLYLETKKKEAKAKTESLVLDWGKFEEDSTKEFVDIGIKHFQNRKSTYGLNYGTVLEITELRSTWDRVRLLKLKASLAKLINPNVGRGEQSFKIYIHVEEEKDADKKERDEKDRVNGEVKNFIFDELGLKTTKVYSSISEDGKYCYTELYDGGTLIYKIKEESRFQLLDSIDITLFYLNQSAKLTFSSRMGVSSIEYGHIFLYKNGFRIYPYGEPAEDPLGIDARKTQGVRRFFGTRELIGQIEIYSDTDQLKETSSRGDGLRKTETYYELVDFFWEVLKKLERYVVQVQKWGLSIENEENIGVKERISKLIATISNSDKIIEFEYPDNLLEILEAGQSKSAQKVIKNLRRIAIETNDNSLLNEVEKAAKTLKEIQLEKEEAEREAEKERKKSSAFREELNETVSQNLFLKSIKSQDFQDLLNLMHHVNISTSTITNHIKNGIDLITHPTIKKSSKEIKDVLEQISIESNKISSIARFATKANFKINTTVSSIDVINFSEEYLLNIAKSFLPKHISLTVTKPVGKTFTTSFRPLELIIIYDNLIINSRKANAKKINIEFQVLNNDSLIIYFKDDGSGIPLKYREKIFDYGFTTTDGSGLGLNHVKELITKLGGEIKLNNNFIGGTEFIITLQNKK